MDNIKLALKIVVKMDGKAVLRSIIYSQLIVLSVTLVMYLSHFLILSGYVVSLMAVIQVALLGLILYAIGSNFHYRWKRISSSDLAKQSYIRFLEGGYDK